MNSFEVAERTGIHYRTLLRLVERGILTPKKVGSGITGGYLWSLADVSEACRIGATLREIKRLQDSIWKQREVKR